MVISMKWNELINVIKAEDDINFVGIAMTPLHLVGVKSVFHYLQKTKIIRGICLLIPHPKTQYVNWTSESDSNDEGINYFKVDDYFSDNSVNMIKSLACLKKYENKKTVYVAYTRLYNKQIELAEILQGSLCFLEIDDGAGSYFVKKPKNQLISSGSLINSLREIKHRAELAYYAHIKDSLIKQNRYLDCRICKIDEDGHFKVNEELKQYYLSSFKTSAHLLTNETLHQLGKCVLINTQCLHENGLTDGIVDLDLYKSFASAISVLKLPVIIKVHPREKNIDKYKIVGNVLSVNEISQEAMLANLDEKPLCIVSLYSSTLLNANLLFDIPVISLAKIMLKMKISDRMRYILNEYIQQYNGIVLFPESFSEIVDYFKNRERNY